MTAACAPTKKSARTLAFHPHRAQLGVDRRPHRGDRHDGHIFPGRGHALCGDKHIHPPRIRPAVAGERFRIGFHPWRGGWLRSLSVLCRFHFIGNRGHGRWLGNDGDGITGAITSDYRRRASENVLDVVSASTISIDFDDPAGTTNVFGSPNALPMEGITSFGDSGCGTFVDFGAGPMDSGYYGHCPGNGHAIAAHAMAGHHGIRGEPPAIPQACIRCRCYRFRGTR